MVREMLLTQALSPKPDEFNSNAPNLHLKYILILSFDLRQGLLSPSAAVNVDFSHDR